ncbi:MAG: ABC transporter substrate-binding protein [Candidatus Binatia bacterium]
MSLRTIELIGILALGLLAGSLPAAAQQVGKVYRIGFLRTGSAPFTSPIDIAFRQGLLELGYVEGQNLVLVYRSAKGKLERLPEIAAKLVRLKVDIILTSGSPRAIRAAKQATRTIPIVFRGTPVDPVARGFVMSLARPGGNITGLTDLRSELHGKRLELLKEAFPRISRVASLWPGSPQRHGSKEVEAVAQALGIQIQSFVVRRMEKLESAFSAISQERPDGLLVFATRRMIPHRARIIDFAAERRLPTMYARNEFVDAGGLMSYGVDFQHLYRRVATYVDKILKGAKPADLPVERPTKFELVINLKTAKKLGLKFSPEFLFQADKLIK